MRTTALTLSLAICLQLALAQSSEDSLERLLAKLSKSTSLTSAPGETFSDVIKARGPPGYVPSPKQAQPLHVKREFGEDEDEEFFEDDEVDVEEPEPDEPVPVGSKTRMIRRMKKLGEGVVWKDVSRRGHQVHQGGHERKEKRWIWTDSIIQDPAGTESPTSFAPHTTPAATLVNPFDPDATIVTASVAGRVFKGDKPKVVLGEAQVSSTSGSASVTPPDNTHSWTLAPYGSSSIWVEVYGAATTSRSIPGNMRKTPYEYPATTLPTSTPVATPPSFASPSTTPLEAAPSSSSTTGDSSATSIPPWGTAPSDPDPEHTYTLVPFGPSSSLWLEVYGTTSQPSIPWSRTTPAPVYLPTTTPAPMSHTPGWRLSMINSRKTSHKHAVAETKSSAEMAAAAAATPDTKLT